jgi:lipid-binding SYLF domain-containing protein
MIRKSILVVCLGLVAAAPVLAENKEQRRLENSGVVMQEIMNTPENIPQEVIEKAECVIVFPSVLKAAFIVGASYGRGAMVCRSGADFRGPWVRQQCMRWRAEALDFKSAEKLLISSCS